MPRRDGSITRRDLGGIIGAAALTGATPARGATTPMPGQIASDRKASASPVDSGRFDMREGLTPRRLTFVEWDQAFLLRRAPGASFVDYARVLGEAEERGYNAVRLDPMPQYLDLARPDRILSWPDPQLPFVPWDWNNPIAGPVGRWLIDFMERLHRHTAMHYTLSAWWFGWDDGMGPPPKPRVARPTSLIEAAEIWIPMLRRWQDRFGFDRLLYVDLANETPFFTPYLLEGLKKANGGVGWNGALSAAGRDYIAREINGALGLLRREFPGVRFTCSIHGDLRWLDVAVEFDCLDVHFYADADPRWSARTRFEDFTADDMNKTDRWFGEFSDRAKATFDAMAPMLRARQRDKMGQFADWARRRGSPITTTEGWASWYYIDHPKLDWGWLLEWAKWSVEDAIEFGFWGWTPHNYTQPQFANWRDVRWHRTLNERFLAS